MVPREFFCTGRLPRRRQSAQYKFPRRGIGRGVWCGRWLAAVSVGRRRCCHSLKPAGEHLTSKVEKEYKYEKDRMNSIFIFYDIHNTKNYCGPSLIFITSGIFNFYLTTRVNVRAYLNRRALSLFVFIWQFFGRWFCSHRILYVSLSYRTKKHYYYKSI